MTNAMVTAHTALHERGKEAKVERARLREVHRRRWVRVGKEWP